MIVGTALALPGRLSPTALALAPGSLVCLVGPNGSGKTSLLHAFAGIGRPSGAVRIHGQNPAGLAPAQLARLRAFLPASRDMAWPVAARDLIALGGARPQEAEAWIDRLDLGAVAARRADRLSTGERGRILLARALAPAPALLLLDEPAANLDPLWQIRLMELLRAELAGTARAALVAMHDLDAAARWGDRMVVMHEGRIAADGRPGELAGEVERIFGVRRAAAGWVAV
jgi:iron complex transport system ATP-binding protein